MNYFIVTSRLALREMTERDAQNAYLLNKDPEVLKYTGDKAFESVSEALDFLKNYNHYKKYGFGRWAVCLKENNEFIGWCGLKFDAEKNEIDIGYRFFKKHWNKGYATESAQACMEWAFEVQKIECVVGRVMKQNLASIKVLKKIGLEFWKNEHCSGEDGVIYRAFNPENSIRNAFQ